MPRIAAKRTADVIEIGGEVPTNGAEDTFLIGQPYIANVSLCGTADYLFHAWNVESVEAKSKAAKGSDAKKTDDLESYVYRDDKGQLAIPGIQIRMALVNAARYLQDPRSPRKSAMDLFKAGIVVLGKRSPVITAATGKFTTTWDYVDRARVVIQRNAVTRSRPALKEGWAVDFDIQVLLPEYISQKILHESLVKAGMFCGIGNNRPSYGRFRITKFALQ